MTTVPAPGLRTAALAALAARDLPALDDLFTERRAELVDAFPDWVAAARGDDDAAQRATMSLAELAGAALARTGDRAMLDHLAGQPDRIHRWGAALEEAAHLVGSARYADAISPLADLLIDVHDCSGPTRTRWLPRTHGLLGQAYFHSGRGDQAVGPTRTALQLADEAGDGAAIVTYLGNLYEIERWLDNPLAAGEVALLMARCFDRIGDTDEAARWRAQAERVRTGEPPVRVVALIDNRFTTEIRDVPRLPSEMVRFLLARNRPALGGTIARIAEGRETGRSGDLDGALAHFEAAARIDPHDPQPHYEIARTLALLERFDAASAAYETVERLAPGWHHVRAQLWLSRHLAAGELAPATLFILCSLEDERRPPDARLELADRELERSPLLPHLHYHRGRLLLELGRPADAETAFARGAELAGEPDIKSSLLWELSLLVASPSRRRTLLERILDLDGANLLCVAQARVTLRQMTR